MRHLFAPSLNSSKTDLTDSERTKTSYTIGVLIGTGSKSIVHNLIDGSLSSVKVCMY